MRLGRKKGFTLIEIITALALVAIAAAVVVPLFTQQLDLFYASSRYNRLDMAGTAIGDFVCESIYEADSVSVSKTGLGGYDHTLRVAGGKLLLDGEDVFGDDFYEGAELKLSAEKTSVSSSDGDTVIFLVELVRGGTMYYQNYFAATSKHGRRADSNGAAIDLKESPALFIEYDDYE